MQQRFYLTKQGLKGVKKEYQRLKKLYQSQKRNAPPFLHSDDLDAEYISFQEDLDYLETRLQELENVLKYAAVIKKPPRRERDKIALGARVLVETNGKVKEFRIVGTVEADPSAGRISNESPLGKALLGHRVGDTVTISSSKIVYKIRKIKY